MFKSKEGISEYSKMIMTRSQCYTPERNEGRDSISEYIRKALEAKSDQERLLNSPGKIGPF